MKQQLLATLQTSEMYTLAVAAAMPENAYHERPAANIMDFNELMNHMAYGIRWWMENYIRKKELAWNPPAPESLKESTMEALKKAYAALEKSVVEAELTDDRVKGVQATLDHITHHRGQACIYLRSKGITPPEYVY